MLIFVTLAQVNFVTSSLYSHLLVSKWEKNERRLLWTEHILNTLKYQVTGKIGTRIRKLRPVTPPCVPEVISGHERS